MGTVSISGLEAQERAGLYSFLARVLSTRPTQDSVWGLNQLAAAYGFVHANGHPLDELDHEYMELFMVSNPRYVAPYESMFRGLPDTHGASGPDDTLYTDDAMRIREPAEDVEECYREAGLTPAKELPDHIGNELRFMAYLWWRQSDAPPAEAERLASIREKFRRSHLLKWIGRLRERVAESDRLGYYHTAFKVAEAVIQDDQ